MVPASLSDLDRIDVEALKALVTGLHAEIASHRAEIAAREAEMKRQRRELACQIEELQRLSDGEIERLKLVIESFSA